MQTARSWRFLNGKAYVGPNPYVIAALVSARVNGTNNHYTAAAAASGSSRRLLYYFTVLFSIRTDGCGGGKTTAVNVTQWFRRSSVGEEKWKNERWRRKEGKKNESAAWIPEGHRLRRRRRRTGISRRKWFPSHFHPSRHSTGIYLPAVVGSAVTNVPKPNVFLPLYILVVPARPNVPLFIYYFFLPYYSTTTAIRRVQLSSQRRRSVYYYFMLRFSDKRFFSFYLLHFAFAKKVRVYSSTSTAMLCVPIVEDTRDMYNTFGTWWVHVAVETGKKPKIQTLSLLRRRRNCQYLFIKTAAAGRTTVGDVRISRKSLVHTHTYRGR